jgi:hypothetical protein
MTQFPEKRQLQRGRIIPEHTIPSEELAKRKAERTKLGLRCREIFERIRPELIDQYYNWFIAIEPDSEEYLIAPKLQGIIQQIRSRYGEKNVMLTTFRLNDTGVCGRI